MNLDFDCPHCNANSWKINDVTSAIMGLEATSSPGGKPSGKYMEVISYVCVKCGYVVFFSIP